MSPHDPGRAGRDRIGHAGIPVPDDLPPTRRSNGAGLGTPAPSSAGTGTGEVRLDAVEAALAALRADPDIRYTL